MTQDIYYINSQEYTEQEFNTTFKHTLMSLFACQKLKVIKGFDQLPEDQQETIAKTIFTHSEIIQATQAVIARFIAESEETLAIVGIYQERVGNKLFEIVRN